MGALLLGKASVYYSIGFCLPGDDIELPSSLSNDSDEIESFEELFQRLAQMKG